MKPLNPYLDFDRIAEEAFDHNGHVLTARTSWSEKYSAFSDRYGVRWMVRYTGDVESSVGNKDSEA